MGLYSFAQHRCTTNTHTILTNNFSNNNNANKWVQEEPCAIVTSYLYCQKLLNLYHPQTYLPCTILKTYILTYLPSYLESPFKSYLPCTTLKTYLPRNSILKTVDLPCTIFKSYLPYTILKTYLPCYSILKTYLPTLKHPQTLLTYLPWSILGSYIPTYLVPSTTDLVLWGWLLCSLLYVSCSWSVPPTHFLSPHRSIDRPTHQSLLSLGTSIFLEHQS